MTVGMIDPRRANTPYYIGDSSDTKPTVVSPAWGARFYETDTGVWFINDGEGAWIEMREPAQGFIPSSAVSSTEQLLEDVLLELVRIRRLLEVSTELDSNDLDPQP